MTAPRPALGAVLRRVRDRNGWTLKEMSQRTGLPLSSLSKVEHGQLSLTYDRLVLISQRLNLPPAEFFGEDAEPERPLTARRSIGRLDQAVRREAPPFVRHFMCPELRRKRMVPVVTEVRACSLEAFGDFVRHSGEEYIYVVRGPVEIHTDAYDPVTLETGESIYIDAAMGHAFVALEDGEPPLVLSVSSAADEGLAEALMAASTGR